MNVICGSGEGGCGKRKTAVMKSSGGSGLRRLVRVGSNVIKNRRKEI